jgi:beta propeller repeat protein
MRKTSGKENIIKSVSIFVFIIAIMVMALIPIAVRAESGYVIQGTETQITTVAGGQFDPSIDGNIVVYTDQSGVDADVWYTDLTTGQSNPVNTATGDQQLTGVSANGKIAYSDWTAMDVIVYDINTKIPTNLTNAALSNSFDPAIDGNLVAWTDDRDSICPDVVPLGELCVTSEIYAKDLNPSGGERRISNTIIDPNTRFSLTNQAPAVKGGKIVWERCDGYACDIFEYDWDTQQTLQITNTTNASERSPDVDGKIIVFQREQGTPVDKNIVAYNLETGVEQVLNLSGDQENAHISGNYVSFNDSSSGISHIGLWDVTTGNKFEVPITSSNQYLNDIDGNRIVYSDDRIRYYIDGVGYNYDINIYKYEFQILSVSPSISVNPQSPNFGDVETGKSISMIVTIANEGSMDLTLDNVSLDPGSSSAFTITQYPQSSVMPGGWTDMSITFTPTGPGSVSGTIQITSNDSLNGTVIVDLAGNGVYAEIPPERQIQEILEFFDTSVTNGTLLGDGPGKSADNRINALRNMLEAAGDLIAKGDMDGAYWQLYDAYLKTDGQPKPPDFVKGPAAAELAQFIQDLMDSLL